MLFLLFFWFLSFCQAETLKCTHMWLHKPKVVISGKPNTLLLGVLNTGEVPQTLFQISAALTNPKNFSQIYRNISGHPYEIVISQGQEATLPFNLELISEPMDAGLVVYVHSAGNGRTTIKTVAMEQVITIKDDKSIFDLESLSIYALIASIVLGYWYLRKPTTAVAPSPVMAAKTASVSSSKKDATDSELEWIPEHIRSQGKKTKKKPSKKD